MAILSALFNNNISSFQEAFGVKDITTEEMQNAIKECFDLYFSVEDSDTEDDCQRLPVIIVNKLIKTIFGEYEATSEDGDGSFAEMVLDGLDEIKKQAMQYCLIGGECLLKPIPKGESIEWLPIRRDCFIPLGRDAHGRLTSVGTAEFTVENETFYSLLERRTVENGKLTIETRLFSSTDATSLGTPVRLDSVERYADLEPEFVLNIDNIGLVQIKTPLLNDVDGTSDGICVFEPARKLIVNINRNERQFNDEFELGQTRLIVSGDMLRTNGGTKTLSDKVFTALDDDPENVGIHPFSPAFREQSYLARKTEYLRNIESLIGFKRGILADVQEQERTATEITSSQGDYNLTIIDFQEVWSKAVEDACTLASEIGQIYKIKGAKDIDPDKLSIDYGDGVLYNRTQTANEMLTMVGAGLLKPELYLAWYYELPHSTPEDLENIRKEYMPELTQMTAGAEA